MGEDSKPTTPTEAPVSAGKSNVLHIYPGDELTPQEARHITYSVPVVLIVLAGDSQSGKTSLLSALYESYQSGPFAGYSFAGSRTLLGFERICHGGRLYSGRSIPATERTTNMDVFRYMHLRLSRDSTFTDCLFADISGELYQEMRKSTVECQRHQELCRADHFVLIIDGKKVSQQETRDLAVDNAHALLRRCVDSHLLGAHSNVTVLMSKWDELLASLGQQAATTLMENIFRAKFLSRFATCLGSLRCDFVAAMPDVTLGTDLPQAYRLDQMLEYWLKSIPTSRLPREASRSVRPVHRMIDLLSLTEGP